MEFILSNKHKAILLIGTAFPAFLHKNRNFICMLRYTRKIWDYHLVNLSGFGVKMEAWSYLDLSFARRHTQPLPCT